MKTREEEKSRTRLRRRARRLGLDVDALPAHAAVIVRVLGDERRAETARRGGARERRAQACAACGEPAQGSRGRQPSPHPPPQAERPRSGREYDREHRDQPARDDCGCAPSHDDTLHLGDWRAPSPSRLCRRRVTLEGSSHHGRSDGTMTAEQRKVLRDVARQHSSVVRQEDSTMEKVRLQNTSATIDQSSIECSTLLTIQII